MASTRIYKYLSQLESVESFLGGDLFCNSLQYFLQIENDGVQGDAFEGIASYEPVDGLQINKITQGNSFNLEGHRLETSLERKEIYICCFSTELSHEIARRFGAIACVEIIDVPKFCELAKAALPADMVLPSVRRNPRIGHRVQYYSPRSPPGNLWAFPALIATSKRTDFAWQQEFRLVFGTNDSFNFQSGDMRITNSPEPPISEIHVRLAKILNVGNISKNSKVQTFNRS